MVFHQVLKKAGASHKAVYEFVRDLGFRWKRGVKRLNKIDPVARAKFAEQIQPLVAEASRGERTLIYVDEAHIHCDVDEGYGWAWGGEPYEIPSSSPGLSKKVSLYGAFVFNDPQVVLWKAPRCNTMFTLAFLFHLKRVLPDMPKLTIVWDGAPWHKPLYMRLIAEKLGFEIVQLPAYSPDFMPVEALWRWLREEVTRNYCHDTAQELVDDVVDFGRRINSDPLNLIRRLWPKLELSEEEAVRATALQLEAAPAPEGTWVPPPPKALQDLLLGAPQPEKLVRLTDGEWERVQAVLLTMPRKRGPRPAHQRKAVEALLWRARTKAPWRALPEAYGPRSTIYDYDVKWRASGVWEKVLSALVSTRASASDVRPVVADAAA